eukprot:783459-Rhodomonas_salina.1
MLLPLGGMSGTDIGCSGIVLYAFAARCPVLVYRLPDAVLRTRYAMSGTQIDYAATRGSTP